MCALFLRGVRGHVGARRRQQVGEVVCAIRSARRARQVDIDVGGLLLRPTNRRRQCGADSAGAAMKALDRKSGESTSTAVPRVRMRPVRLRACWVKSVPRKTFAYSDAEWRKIKDILACVGIDADAMTIGDEWWAQPTAAALVAEPRRPLREQLQGLAAEF